jgi:predicted GTPase
VKRCLVVGKPNVGKSLFVIRFAAFLGVRRLEVECAPPGGTPVTLRLRPDEARQRLVAEEPYTTRRLQAVTVPLASPGGRAPVQIVDSAALSDRVHPDPAVRQAMAQSLQALSSADAVIHLVDAAEAGRSGVEASLGEIDRQLASYAALRIPYVVLANKMDLAWARLGCTRIRDHLKASPVVAVSALRGHGLRELRLHLSQRL